MKKTSKAAIMGLICLFALSFAGCATKQDDGAASRLSGDDQASTGGIKQILDITAVPTAEGTDVIIQGGELLTYTALKQPHPPAVTLYFPDTTYDASGKIDVDNTLVSNITTETYNGEMPKTKVQIHLTHDIPYKITRDNLSLRVALIAQGDQLSASGSSMGAQSNQSEGDQLESPSDDLVSGDVPNRVQSITSEKSASGVTINLIADGPISRTESFTLSNPARVVFDLPGIESPSNQEEILAVNSKWVKRLRYYSDNQKLRVVLDSEDQYLKSFKAVPQPNGMTIYAGGLDHTDTVVSGDGVGAKDAPARINTIDFVSKREGRSTIELGIQGEVNYEVRKLNDRQIQLELINTAIDDRYLRPLITTHFDSAVDRITPLQPKKSGEPSLVVIDTREAVPYYIEEAEGKIQINFEASSISPQELDPAQLAQANDSLSEAETMEGVSDQPTVGGAGSTAGKKAYTGEKIALDFFETDIKNVFRILREISGKNFAIDQDVTGKVTLTLDKPVPWDQVLDLVLKMNQLGMKDEGNIIRIGTLETFRKEEELVRARIEAESKTREQQKSLEPLLTEYIEINYSNAKDDILPHLAGLLTPDRGSISVNERTNQVILNDTAETIKKAHEIVKQLDRVTPQVLIEARIVEASSSFGRELGVQWAMQSGLTLEGINGPDDTIVREATPKGDNDRGTAYGTSGIGPTRGYDLLGGTYNWDSAVNLPTSVTPAGSFNFNFIRLEGTPFVLNATLQALESQGKGKIVSSPKILTLDNKKAMIKQGIRYPYNKLDDSGNTTTQFEDIDLVLEVTPHVTLDDRVLLSLNIKKKDLGAVILGNQSFISKEAQTELLVDDGDTIVIGGIIKSSERESETGLPWLRKLPLFGWLFKVDSQTDDKEELLIFITPKIVRLDQQI